MWNTLVVLVWILLTCFNGLQTQDPEGPKWHCTEGKFCYLESKTTSDRPGAQRLCAGVASGATLAILDTKGKIEAMFLYLEKKNEGHWIGLSRNNNAREWQWADGSQYYETTRWAEGHPMATNNFAYYWNKMFVSTPDGSQELRVICQTDKEKSSTKVVKQPITKPTILSTTAVPYATAASISTRIIMSTNTTTVASTMMPTEVTMDTSHSNNEPQVIPSPTSNVVFTQSSKCDNNWDFSDASQTCYTYFISNFTWARSKEICVQNSAHLATPATSEKHDELVDYIWWRQADLYYKNGWIGLYHPAAGGSHTRNIADPKEGWTWVDGSSYDPMKSQWASLEPGEREKWTRVRTGDWYATDNETAAEYFICQKAAKESSGPDRTDTVDAPILPELPGPQPPTLAPVVPNIPSPSTTTSGDVYPVTNIPEGPPSTSKKEQFTKNSQACGDNSNWLYSIETDTCYSMKESNGAPRLQVQQTCENDKGNLAAPYTEEKFMDIVAFITNKSLNTVDVWIGLRCSQDIDGSQKCSMWKWSNGAPYQWTSWAEGEPGVGERWVRVRHGRWYATHDERDAHYFICEKDAKDVTPKPTDPTNDVIPNPNGGGPVTGKNKGTRKTTNLSVLAVLLVIIPITIIIALVILVKKRKLRPQSVLKFFQTKKNKDETNTEAGSPQLETAFEPYYLTANTAIPVSQLEKFSSRPDRVISIHLEFESIPANMGLPQTVANKPINKTKNRFKDIKPYDQNRVKLSTIAGLESSDYINASLIASYENERAFIASCGPTQHTMGDFWRMIWEYNIKCVVMLTQQMEGAKEMCKQYWPSRKTQVFGDYEVKLEQEDKLTDYICRHLKVSHGVEEREIVQLQMESWLDMRIPDSAVGLLNLRRQIRKFLSKDSPPILVHCRAGVGRTGTFFALDYLLEQAAKEDIVDVAKCVAKLRAQRVKMVQTGDQYEFVYQAVTEGVLLGETCIKVYQFPSVYSKLIKTNSNGTTKLDYEFKLMTESSTNDQKPGMKRRKSYGMLTINKTKNRTKNIIADDSFRISLVTKAEGRNDYINAVAVDSLERKYAFIATQAPLVGTAIDFWRAVWDCKCRIIVMLSPQHQLENKDIYYPEVEEEVYSVPPFEVECTSVRTKELVSSKEFALSLTDKRQVLHLSVTSDLNSKKSEELLDIFLALYEAIKKRKTKSNYTAPLMVHCLDGAEWSGLFCAFFCLMGQIEYDKEIDVFNVVRLVRQSCSQFVATKEQYSTLYEMMYHHIRGSNKGSKDSKKAEKPSSTDSFTPYDNVEMPVASTSSSPVVTSSDDLYVNVSIPVATSSNDYDIYVNAEAIDKARKETISQKSSLQ